LQSSLEDLGAYSAQSEALQDYLSRVFTNRSSEVRSLGTQKLLGTERAVSLMARLRLLFSMINLRIAGDDCKSINYAVEAYELLEDLSLTCCNRSVMNWRGNALNCFQDFQLSQLNSAQPIANDMSGRITSICFPVFDCNEKAETWYKRAGNGAGRCSADHLRMVNNILDLRLDFARNFNTQRLLLGKKFVPLWMRSSESLATSLTHLSTILVRCSYNDPINITGLITASQAFAAAASLRAGESNQDAWKVDLQRSGYLLAAAVVARPEDARSWNLTFLCGAIAQDHEKSLEFYRGVNMHSVAHPDLTTAVGEIVSAKCPTSV
jgi:hypothetical protein